MELNKKLNEVASKFLTAAVLKLYPQAKFANDELIDNGFRSVFRLPEDQKISINDFNKIKKTIEKLLSSTQMIKFEKMDRKQLMEIYKDNKYYHSFLASVKEDTVSVIRIGDFVALCSDASADKLPNARFITLHSIGGFYWQGDADKDQLVAIDGWAVSNETEFKE